MYRHNSICYSDMLIGRDETLCYEFWHTTLIVNIVYLFFLLVFMYIKKRFVRLNDAYLIFKHIQDGVKSPPAVCKGRLTKTRTKLRMKVSGLIKKMSPISFFLSTSSTFYLTYSVYLYIYSYIYLSLSISLMFPIPYECQTYICCIRIK